MPPPVDPRLAAAAGASGVGGDKTGDGDGRTKTPPPGAGLTPEELEALRHDKARAGGIKGNVTKYIPQLEQAIKDLNNFPTEHAYKDLERLFSLVEDNTDKLIELYNKIMFNDVEKNVEAWEKKIQEANARFINIKTQFKKAIYEVGAGRTAGAAPTPGAGFNPGAGGALPRINDSLKPDKLTKEWQPREFRGWRDQFRVFYEASSLSKYPLSVQHGYFRGCLDTDLQARLEEALGRDENKPAEGSNELPVLEGTPEDPRCLMAILEKIYEAFWTLYIRRVNFFKFRHRPGQLFSEFVAQAKQKALEADLASMSADDILLYQIVSSCVDDDLKVKFLRLKEPALTDIEREYQAYEAGNQAMKIDKKEENRVQKAAQRKFKKQQEKLDQQGQQQSNTGGGGSGKSQGGKRQINTERKKALKDAGLCYCCGGADHNAKKCPKKDTLYCKICDKPGHSTKVCMFGTGPLAKKLTQSQPATRQSSPNRTSVVRNEVKSLVSRPTPKVQLILEQDGGRSLVLSACPDTGATRSIISREQVKKGNFIFKTDPSEKLYTADNRPIDCGASIQLKTRIQGQDEKENVNVNAVISSDVTDSMLLSWFDMKKLKLIPPNFPAVQNLAKTVSDSAQDETCLREDEGKEEKKHQKMVEDDDDDIKKLLEEYSDVISDELKEGAVMTGPPMNIKLREDVEIKPRRCLTARQTPLHYQQAAKELVDKLLGAGIISRVDQPTDWISPAHFVPKPDGSVRLVTDYQQLNSMVDRPVHPFPSSLDMLRFIEPGSQWFCKMDALQGYFQVPLSENSRLLTTFLLPEGKFCYNRAPMGYIGSGDEYNIRSDLVVRDVKRADKLVDDILARGNTKEELLHTVKQVLDNCRKYGMTVSKKKFEVGQSLHFAGHIVSKDGIKPSPTRIKAIEDFPAPTDVSTLRGFLGLANQLGHFIPDLSQASMVLRGLLGKDIAWTWEEDHQVAFENIKKLLSSSMVLHPFDPTLETILLTDASKLHGMGFALVQKKTNGRIQLVECASVSLTKTQQRYAVIELECLAILQGIKKFSYYLKGCHFQVYTDHRPLVGIFKKPLQDIENARLLRFKEALSSYSFSVQWVEGKTHMVADFLSRNPVFHPHEEEEEVESNGNLCQRVQEDPIFQSIFEAIEEDTAYQQIIDALRKGKKPNVLPPFHPAQQFKGCWDYLSLYDDEPSTLLVFHGDRIVVPKAARHEILELIHKPHAGVVKTRKHASQKFFWPGMGNDVEQMVKSCEVCQEALPSLPAEPLILREATEPMQDCGSDLFFWKKDFLIMVDRYSGYPFCAKLRKTDTEAVTKQLMDWMLEYGFVKRLYTDNGPQYRDSFDKWCAKYNIIHEISSAEYPQSNGLAEAAVKQVKGLLKKTTKLDQSFKLALLEYRNTPRSDGFSPAEMFFGRRQRTLLPALPVQPNLTFAEAARGLKREIAKEKFDEHTTSLPKFHPGDRVIMQDSRSKEWAHPGVVVEVRESGRSYKVRLDGAERLYLRNRRFLRKDFRAEKEETSGDNVRKENKEDLRSSSSATPRRSERIKQRNIRSVHFQNT